MALKLKRRCAGGVTATYHRVVSVNTITGVQTIVEVGSYIDKDAREEERGAIAAGGDMDVYVSTEFFDLPCDEDMGVTAAYEWLKAQPGWEGAKDC